MVTKEKMINGLLSYVDAEVIPKLPTSGKWVMGTMMCLVTPKANEVADTLIDNSLVKALNVVDEHGLIDEVKLIESLSMSARKYGNLEMVVPIVGTLSFSYQDVQKLALHMTEI